MNILLYSKASVYGSERIGGAETSMALMASSLAALGHRVFYLTFREPEDAGLVQYETHGKVSVIFYTPPKYQRKLLIKKKMKAAGKTAAFEAFLLECLKEKGIDLVYSHYDRAVLLSFLKVRDEFAYKLVMRMAGLKWFEESQESDSLKDDYEMIFRSVDAINYNTTGLEKLCYQSAEQINFNYQPRLEFTCDIGAQAVSPPVQTASQPGGPFRIVVATRFSNYQKRQDILVEALALLKDRLDYRVLMIGSGPKREAIEALIAEKGLQDRVEIVPFMTQNDLWRSLCESDLLCHPCEYEGLSKIIVESMMLGLPVLVSDVLPISDYVIDGKTGFLTENKPTSWSEKILSVATDSHHLQTIGEQAKQSALEAFDVETNAVRYEENFKCLLDQV